MSLGYLIVLSLALGVLAWLFFMWTVRTGQYEDPEGAKYRMLEDDEGERPTPQAPPSGAPPPEAPGAGAPDTGAPDTGAPDTGAPAGRAPSGRAPGAPPRS